MNAVNFQTILEHPGWYSEAGPDQQVVFSSRARLSRNLSGYFFPHKLNDKELQEVQENIGNAFKSIRLDEHFTVKVLEDLPVLERRKLIEKHFVSQNYSLEKRKLVIFDQNDSVAATVNQTDHLQLAAFTGGLSIQRAYEKVSALERRLEKQLNFAVSLDRGYLSSDLKNCGTGLQVSVLLHLPALKYSSVLERAFRRVMDAGLEVRGFTGDDDGSLGSLYQVFNPVAIGENEKDIVEKLARIASQLVDYEQKARDEMKRHRRIELEDIVYRAYGTLTNCRLLQEKEAINLLSDVRLGVALGWIEVPIQIMNALLVLVGKAHLQQITGNEQQDESSQHIKSLRARLVQHALSAYKEEADV
ncbi:MAG: hypothetical protein R6V86_05175 [Spirochaetia bacterium]